MSKPWTQHIIGEPDLEEQTQRCVLCGEVIIDYRGISYPEEQGPPPWWTAGPIYIKGGVTMLGVPDDFITCNQ